MLLIWFLELMVAVVRNFHHDIKQRRDGIRCILKWIGYVIRFRVYISQGVVEGRMMMLGIQRG